MRVNMKLPKQAQPVVRNATSAEKSTVNRGEVIGIYPSYSECWDKPTSAGVIGCAVEAAVDWMIN
jgi:hypothetical protein